MGEGKLKDRQIDNKTEQSVTFVASLGHQIYIPPYLFHFQVELSESDGEGEIGELGEIFGRF